MPIRRGAFGGAVNLLPSITIGATTDFTESRGIFNATINGNLANTTVAFHYSTASNFSSFTSIAGSGSGTGSFSSSATVAGLAVNTLYYVRAVATSSIGAVTSSSTSFTTWSLKTLAYTSSGSFTVPTVSGVNPAALVNVLVVGGGAGGVTNDSGGGGGGYRYTTSRAFNGTSGALTITVGGGGAASTATTSGAGGDSSLAGTNLTTLTAGGAPGAAYGGNPAGNVGSGDNPAYTGGTYYADYSLKTLSDASGGGAGVAGNGGNGAPSAGGNGGAGATTNGYGYGSGGGGGGENYVNGTQGSHGSPTSGYGLGGNGHATAVAGTAGLVVFSYYGP